MLTTSSSATQGTSYARVLLACEFSGTVREAFRKIGMDAWSCDLLPSDIPSTHHIQDDVLNHLNDGWDMMIAFPPCTHLAVSGARWFKEKQREQEQALDFVKALMNAPIKRKAIENPVSIISSHVRKPDQIIQPWQFGHGETKQICLWLWNLPLLKPTKIVEGREHRIWFVPRSENRWKIRSSWEYYSGIASAMADQWGRLYYL